MHVACDWRTHDRRQANPAQRSDPREVAIGSLKAWAMEELGTGAEA